MATNVNPSATQCMAKTLAGERCTQPATKRSGYKYCAKHERSHLRAVKGAEARGITPPGMSRNYMSILEQYISDPDISNLRPEIAIARLLLRRIIERGGIPEKSSQRDEIRKQLKQIANLCKYLIDLEEKGGYLVSIYHLSNMFERIAEIIKEFIHDPATREKVVQEIRKLPWSSKVKVYDSKVLSERYGLDVANKVEPLQVENVEDELDKLMEGESKDDIGLPDSRDNIHEPERDEAAGDSDKS